MPEISRFYGIVIKMFYNDHPPPGLLKNRQMCSDRALNRRMPFIPGFAAHYGENGRKMGGRESAGIKPVWSRE
jgi:hypothetical protein